MSDGLSEIAFVEDPDFTLYVGDAREIVAGWHEESWTWEDEERDTRARLCLCCGKPGHHQEVIEALVARDGLIRGVCIADDGKLHDGHHRIIAAKRLGIAEIPLETRAEADARWEQGHGTHIWELRRFGDIPPGKHWDWIQMIRQEARNFVKWEESLVDNTSHTCLSCGRRSVIPHGDSYRCRECGAEEPWHEAACETLQTDRYQGGESPHNPVDSPRDAGTSGGAT